MIWRVKDDVFAGVVRPRSRSELLASGVTPRQLRGPRWQRTSQGRYVPAGVDTTASLQRIVNAASRLPVGGAVGGWAAARALGVVDCDGLDIDGRTLLDVPLCTGRRHIDGGERVVRWYDPLEEADVVDVGGIRCTGAARTTFDRMRRASDLREAVVAADQMTHAQLVTVAEMVTYVDEHPRWRGVEQARRALELCDPDARNAWETRMRMVWLLDAGLPRPRCNPPLFDLQENLLGYPDLFDPVAGVVFEYDGADHRRTRQHDRDNIREEQFEDHGLVVARVGRPSLEDRDLLAARMRRTRERGLARDRRRDRWTLQIPPSWGPYDAYAEFRAAVIRGEV